MLISRTDWLLANWQNNIDTKWVQLLKPLLCLSVCLSFTKPENFLRSSLEIICENSVMFDMRRGWFFLYLKDTFELKNPPSSSGSPRLKILD